MPDASESKQQQQQQQDEPRGIAAAAIEGAKESERRDKPRPDDHAAQLARPQPGMTEQPAPSPSSTSQYTGITGGLSEDQDDEDQEWRRAGGADPDTTPDKPSDR